MESFDTSIPGCVNPRCDTLDTAGSSPYVAPFTTSWTTHEHAACRSRPFHHEYVRLVALLECENRPMDVAFEVPGALSIVTAAERPDLWTRVETADLFSAAWPEYNGHGDLVGEYFGALMPRFGDLQVMVVDREAGDVVGRGRTIPFRWDGDLDSLPTGIDALGLRAFEQDHPTSLSALAAEVVPARQRQGISALIIEAMAETASSAWARALGRASTAELERLLSARPDPRLRDMARFPRVAIRSVDESPRTARCTHPSPRTAITTHHGSRV